MTAQRSESWAQHISPYYKEIESLSDPISSRPSAAATVSGHRPPWQQMSTGTARPNIGRKPSPRRRSDWKVGHNISVRTIKKSGRCPTRFRRDQARQQLSAGTARPNIGRKPSPRRRSDRKVGHNISVRTIKKSGRCPTRFRRDQARQQLSAGTARRGSNCQRTPPAQT